MSSLCTAPSISAVQRRRHRQSRREPVHCLHDAQSRANRFTFNSDRRKWRRSHSETASPKPMSSAVSITWTVSPPPSTDVVAERGHTLRLESSSNLSSSPSTDSKDSPSFHHTKHSPLKVVSSSRCSGSTAFIFAFNEPIQSNQVRISVHYAHIIADGDSLGIPLHFTLSFDGNLSRCSVHK